MKKLHPVLSTPFFAMLGRAGGMVIPFFIAYFYGAGPNTDAFFFAFGLIFFLATLAQQLFETVLLPFLAEQRKIAPGRPLLFTAKVLGFFLPGLAAVALAVGFGLAPFLDATSSLGADTARLTSGLYMQMIPFLLIGVLISAANGILNHRRAFWFPAVSPLIRSIVVIAFLFLLHQAMKVYALTAGFVAGETIRWTVSLYLLIHLGILARGTINKKALAGIHTGGFWKQAGYQITALGTIQLIPVINQWFASRLDSGDLSLLNYADRLFMIPFQIFLTGISQVMLTDWSDAYYESARPAFRSKVLGSVSRAFWISAAVSAAAWLLRDFITGLAFGYARISEPELKEIAGIFGWLMLGFAPAVAVSLYLRILFVMRHAGLFLAQSVGRLLVQAALNAFLVTRFGVQGIAMATALTAAAGTLWLHLYIRHALHSAEERAA